MRYLRIAAPIRIEQTGSLYEDFRAPAPNRRVLLIAAFRFFIFAIKSDTITVNCHVTRHA